MLTPAVRRRARRGTEAGVSMIELMIAGVIMVVGFLGLMILITTAIATNNRNKLDTNSTLVAQMILEEVRAQIASGGSPSLTDCASNTVNINTTPGGATLSGGTIDFSAALPTATVNGAYSMNFTVCTANGGQATYDVRWNVQALTASSWLITVGSRPRGATSDLKYFALPVTLRSIVGV
jgi:Tfp pilus assembly protein PilV